MSKAVLISIRPEWCAKIASGKKTIEVRKTRPKLPTPFKCYLYECKKAELKSVYKVPYLYSYGYGYSFAKANKGCGKIIGEFVCDRIDTVEVNSTLSEHPRLQKETCLSELELAEYLSGAVGYAWHISELKIYDKPKALSEFEGLQKTRFGYAPYKITRPPQSFCYVEELA